jgi:predicted GIY-YIG superfamily endonuclease
MLNINGFFNSCNLYLNDGLPGKENDSSLSNVSEDYTSIPSRIKCVVDNSLNNSDDFLKTETNTERNIVEVFSLKRRLLVPQKREINSLTEPLSKRRQLLREEEESIELKSVESVAETTASIFDKTEAEQSRFFTNQEPKEWFSVYRDGEQKIQFALPFDLQDDQCLIYVIKNEVKKCLLIGETGGVRGRFAKYTSWINQKGSEDRVKSIRKKAFLTDIKEHPEHFKVGILYVLRPQEDPKRFEKAFIKYQGQVWDLYNDNGGGGGGRPHRDDDLVYAVPKPGTAPYTPEKYYRYKREGVNIRPQFSPGFKDRVRKSKRRRRRSFSFPYVIRKLDTSSCYVGVTNDPERRALEHAYEAEYKDPLNEKYDPTHGGGYIHPALAEDPETFAIGLLPVQVAEDIEPERLSDFVLLQGRAEVERYTIRLKESLVTQQGFNCNGGGGGPCAHVS